MVANRDRMTGIGSEGKYNPSLQLAFRLARTLDVNTGQLFQYTP